MALNNFLDTARRAIAGTSADKTASDDTDPESLRRPLLRMDLSPRQSFGPAPPRGTYGTTDETSAQRHSLIGSAGAEGALRGVPEEDEEDDDEWDFELQGPDGGVYTSTLRLYALVPATSLLALLLLGLLPPLLFPPASPPTSLPLLPYPLPALLLSAALWALSHLLHLPIYTLCSLLLPSSLLCTLVSTALHVLARDALRLLALPLLLAARPSPLLSGPGVEPAYTTPAFADAWHLALGWALAEALAASAQGFAQLQLYAPSPASPPFTPGAFPGPDEASPLRAVRPADNEGGGLEQSVRWLGEEPGAVQSELALERQLDRLVALKARQEVEDVFGLPVTHIPVFVSCLQRIAGIVVALGFGLLLAGAYVRSSVSLPPAPPSPNIRPQPSLDLHPHPLPAPTSDAPLATAFALVSAAHLALALLHAPPVLPRVGLHTAAYVAVVVGLGSVFAGLGLWGVLS